MTIGGFTLGIYGSPTSTDVDVDVIVDVVGGAGCMLAHEKLDVYRRLDRLSGVCRPALAEPSPGATILLEQLKRAAC